MRRWGSLTGLLLCLALFATGCWDRVEIEERGFVVGAGIDVAGEDDADKYILTFQFVIPGGLQGMGAGRKTAEKAGTKPTLTCHPRAIRCSERPGTCRTGQAAALTCSTSA